MKRIIAGIVMVLAAGICFGQQLTVAVSPFEARSGFTQEEAEGITELFTSELVARNAAKVVDRNNFDKIITEMQFQMSDWSDSQKVARLGAALNADSIIRGQITKLGSQIVVTASILDIKTAQILSSSRIQVKDIDEVFGKISGFVGEMVKNLPQPNRLIGKWGNGRDEKSSSIIFEFKANGELAIHKWEYENMGKHDGGIIYNKYIGGHCTYSLDKDRIILKGSRKMSLSQNVYNRTKKVDERKTWVEDKIIEKIIPAYSIHTDDFGNTRLVLWSNFRGESYEKEHDVGFFISYVTKGSYKWVDYDHITFYVNDFFLIR